MMTKKLKRRFIEALWILLILQIRPLSEAFLPDTKSHLTRYAGRKRKVGSGCKLLGRMVLPSDPGQKQNFYPITSPVQ